MWLQSPLFLNDVISINYNSRHKHSIMKSINLIFILLLAVAFSGSSLQAPESYASKGGLRVSQRQVPRGGRQLISPSGNPATYTLNTHFSEGSMINCNYDDVSDQIQLNSQPMSFNYMFVAVTFRSTVVKVNTDTGEILGEYRTVPQNFIPGQPRRTAIDNDGSAWVSNRIGSFNDKGSVVHIGLLENDQCEDRNGNGKIDTSNGLGDIKSWIVVGTPERLVESARDECIIHYTIVNSKHTHHLSVDASNNVWVSGTKTRIFDLVKGGRYDVADSGTILKSEGPAPDFFGGYGGIIDENGFVWSTLNLMRWDPTKSLTGTNGDPDPAGPDLGPPNSGTSWAGQADGSIGLCSDSEGNIWTTKSTGNVINKYDSNGQHLGQFNHGHDRAHGCAVDKANDDDIWVAHSTSTTVGHIKKDGTLIGTVDLEDMSQIIDPSDPRIKGTNPTGIAVDAKGKIWSTNAASHSLSRIDPNLNGGTGGVDLTVDLKYLTVILANPQNYGDMTGSKAIAPPNCGTWEVVHDSGELGAQWQIIKWNEEALPGDKSHEPGDSKLTVNIAAVASLGDNPNWRSVTNGQILSDEGRYLKIKVSFDRASTGESPILSDITVSTNRPPECDNTYANPSVLWPPNHNFEKIIIEGATDPDGDDISITIDTICQDEEVDSSTVPDGKGVGTDKAEVRLERKGGMNGRVYHIAFTVDDGMGSCQGSVIVCVPHDGKDETCEDDSPLYDSTKPSSPCPNV